VNGQQQATVTVSFPSAGTHSIQATYSPDAASTGVFNTSSSNMVNEVVNNGAATTTTLTASPQSAGDVDRHCRSGNRQRLPDRQRQLHR
jgi:hypothetical protein